MSQQGAGNNYGPSAGGNYGQAGSNAMPQQPFPTQNLGFSPGGFNPGMQLPNMPGNFGPTPNPNGFPGQFYSNNNGLMVSGGPLHRNPGIDVAPPGIPNPFGGPNPPDMRGGGGGYIPGMGGPPGMQGGGILGPGPQGHPVPQGPQFPPGGILHGGQPQVPQFPLQFNANPQQFAQQMQQYVQNIRGNHPIPGGGPFKFPLQGIMGMAGMGGLQ